jgi:hypothetical protein
MRYMRLANALHIACRYHAWESLAMKYLEHMTPSSVMKGESSFTRMAKAFVGPEDAKVEKLLLQQRSLTEGENGEGR